MGALQASIPNDGNYIALIGDMVRSRDFIGEERSLMQDSFNRLIEHLNRRYATHLRAQFTVTLADEFQALLKEPSAVPDIIWEVRQTRTHTLPNFRLGIGFGRIDSFSIETAKADALMPEASLQR
jgi:hypothetical protein